MPTPNRGYVYPATSSPATVPADLRAPLEQVDADMQTLVDELGEMVSLNPDGTLPEAAEQQVEAIARENGTPPGSIPIFSTLAEAQAWELANPGRVALTTEAPPDPGAWVAAAPAFDLVTGRIAIPSDAGATYTINGAPVSAGSHPVEVPSTVTVAAVAKAGYTLAGQTEWVQAFEEYVDPYTAAALALNPQHYFAFDDGALPPRDRGTAAGAGFLAQETTDFNGPDIGVGASSFLNTGNYILQGRPAAAVPAFSFAAVVSPSAGPFFYYCQAWDGTTQFGHGDAWGDHRVQAKFPGMTSAQQFSAPGAYRRTMHLAFTWDGATGRVYMDGAEIGSAAASGTFNAQAAGMYIARKSSGSTVAMAGVAMDFTRAWSAAEVASLAEAVGA